MIGDKVGEKAVEQYHHAGKSRELFADKSETDIYGDYVQSYVYDAERKHYACKLFYCTLYEYGHSCHAAWVKTACVYKGLCVKCHKKGGDSHGDNCKNVFSDIFFHGFATPFICQQLFSFKLGKFFLHGRVIFGKALDSESVSLFVCKAQIVF